MSKLSEYKTWCGLEPIINLCCIVKTTSFDELREEIITNITYCDLTQASITPLQLSKLKESNGRKLIMTRPKFREYFRRQLYITLHKNKLVKEKGHHIEDVIFVDDGLNRDMVEEMIEECLKIFVEKQKGLIWDLNGLKGNSILCINSEKEESNYIYLFDVDYKKIFNWIFDNFQNIKTWNKENLKGDINKKDIIRINNDNFDQYMNFKNLKTYSIMNTLSYPFHPYLDITIDIKENKMYIGGLDVESFEGALHEMCKAASYLHINNLNFEYFEAEDESGDSYGMNFNLDEICKLIQ